MTQEEIKKTWADASRRMFRPTPEEFENMYRDNKMTALENLASRYRRFSMLGMAMIFCSFAWLGSSLPFVNQTTRITATVLMMIYFATCSMWDWWFYKGLTSIDCYTMSVREVSEKALYYRKKHLQSMMVLFPFAVIVVGMMAYSLAADRYILLGMAAGGLTGLIVGYRQFRRFMDEYKIVVKE